LALCAAYGPDTALRPAATRQFILSGQFADQSKGLSGCAGQRVLMI
jgi:hypothetical protein